MPKIIAQPKKPRPGLDESLSELRNRKPTPEMLGTGGASKAGKALRDRKKRLKEALGE